MHINCVISQRISSRLMRVKIFLILFLELVMSGHLIAQIGGASLGLDKRNSQNIYNNQPSNLLLWLHNNGISIQGQEQERVDLKFSASLFSAHMLSSDFLVKISDENRIPEYLKGLIYSRNAGVLSIRNEIGLIGKLLSDPEISFVQVNYQPSVETTIPKHDLSVNHIDWFKSTTGFRGNGQLVGIKERSADTLDVDLRRKFVVSDLADSEYDTHATAMASLIAGRGNTSIKSLGVAQDASLISSSFKEVFPDPKEFLNALSVQNHSYGFEIQNEYDILAEAYDLSTYEDPLTLHVFSAGNLGLSIPENGAYKGIGELSNLSGGIKHAKNTLVIGATNQNYEVDERSSKGPAYDGRIKPELVAYGAEGTSEAAALVSGSAALLQQMYLDQQGELSENYLLKSIMISSATDIEYPGPDYVSGFGSLNMQGASTVIANNQFFTKELSGEEIYETVLTIPSGKKAVRVSLNWNDPAASPGSLSALVNDLDLEVEYDGQIFRPLVPNSSPNEVLFFQPASQQRDSLNNNELVIIPDLSVGKMKVRVKAFAMKSDQQPFAVSYSFEDKNSFEWLIPTEGVALEMAELFYLRFDNTVEAPVELYLRKDKGPWGPVGPVLDNLSFTFDEPGLYEFMVRIKGDEIISPKIIVHPKLEFAKLYECDEALLFNWSDIGAETYGIYGVDSETFERILISSVVDTSVFLTSELSALAYEQISFQPTFDGQNGVQGSLYNFGSDGIGCYVKSFSSAVDDNRVRLDLQLTTNLHVESVSFIRAQEGREKQFDAASTEGLNYLGETSENANGYYRYKGLIKLSDSELEISEIETSVIELPIVLSDTNVLFPNPLNSGEELFFLGSANLSRIRLFSVDGTYSTVIYVNSNEQFFELKGISSGLYLYQLISSTEEIIDTGKLIVK